MSRISRNTLSIGSTCIVGLFASLAAAQDAAQSPAAPDAEPATTVEEAPDDGVTRLPEVVVRGRAEDLLGTAVTASQGAIGAIDLENMPLLRRGELLERVPGMVVTQHSGDGKANQYFLRGFNLDHGTDFAFSVDGVPVNLWTHAHGQGYADLNFMIPELVELIEYKKGPFYAEVGDFSGSGAANLHIRTRLPQAIAQVHGGMFNYLRALAADSPKLGRGNLLYALEYNHYDGPWDLEQNSHRWNGLVRYGWDRGADHFDLTASAYVAPQWRATDQVPERAVDAGMISRLGTVDDSDGGNTGRGSLWFNWIRTGERSLTKLLVYGFYYRLNLWSNFTYFLDDPVNGDQFEQVDRRFVAGASFEHTLRHRWGGRDVENTAGAQLRNDFIPTVALNRTARRELVSVTSDDSVAQLAGGVFARNQIRWSDWLRTMVGARADVYAVKVDSSVAANSGDDASAIVSGKAGVVFGPWARTELYANVGTGFHSNDARGVTITVGPEPGMRAEQVPLLVRTYGAEIGTRTSILPGLVSTVSLWYLRSQSELTFAGDSGATEANPATEKLGVEIASFYKPTTWLTLSADLSLTRARYVENEAGPYIANSIPAVLSASAAVEAPFGLFGGARLRHFSSQPLVEDNSVRAPSSTLVDAKLGYRIGRFDLAVDVLNLFDAEAHDIAYFYTSRLSGEAEASDDVHAHPVEPLAIRGGVTFHY